MVFPAGGFTGLWIPSRKVSGGVYSAAERGPAVPGPPIRARSGANMTFFVESCPIPRFPPAPFLLELTAGAGGFMACVIGFCSRIYSCS